MNGDANERLLNAKNFLDPSARLSENSNRRDEVTFLQQAKCLPGNPKLRPFHVVPEKTIMKYFLHIACFMLLLVSVTRAGEVPPLPGDATSLRLPPTDAPHGPTTKGLTLALWTEKPEYELNTRMNVWIMLSNTNRDSSGRIVPYDPAIHKDDYLIITDEDGKQTKIKGEHPCDGPVGVGFEGGVSAQLHEKIRQPGVYKLRWRIGAMESNVIEVRVTAPGTKKEGKAQPATPPYLEPAARSPQR